MASVFVATLLLLGERTISVCHTLDVPSSTGVLQMIITSDNSGYFCNADKREFIDKADLPVDDVAGGPWVAGSSQASTPTAPGGRVGLRPRSHPCRLPGV